MVLFYQLPPKSKGADTNIHLTIPPPGAILDPRRDEPMEFSQYFPIWNKLTADHQERLRAVTDLQ